MNGKTYAYLDLATLPAVGAVLLDPRPAFVFRGDGSGVLWANAAGVAFFGEPAMGALLDRRFSPSNPVTQSLARLAKSLPADDGRIEILRFNFGVRQATLPSLCRRLDLGSGRPRRAGGRGRQRTARVAVDPRRTARRRHRRGGLSGRRA